LATTAAHEPPRAEPVEQTGEVADCGLSAYRDGADVAGFGVFDADVADHGSVETAGHGDGDGVEIHDGTSGMGAAGAAIRTSAHRDRLHL
jgi:hypothetical protein